MLFVLLLLCKRKLILCHVLDNIEDNYEEVEKVERKMMQINFHALKITNQCLALYDIFLITINLNEIRITTSSSSFSI